MRFLDLVGKRSSTRSFLPNPVEREKIERCLEAARQAPSACNGQPWHFIVVESQPLKNNLAEKAFSGPHKMNSFAIKAPAIVAVVTFPTKTAASFAGFFRRLSYPLIDIGIACEHFVLQATEEGLGTCWIGWFNERAVKDCLSLGFQERVSILLAVGYSDKDTHGLKKRKGLQEMSEFR